MSLELLRYPTYLWAILLFILMGWLVVVFILHFFVPKSLLKNYFKEPYFSPAEIGFFTGFPFGYIRTVMFMRLVAFPNSGKKRGLTSAYTLAPSWFRVISKVIVVSFLTVSLPMIGLGLLFFFAL